MIIILNNNVVIYEVLYIFLVVSFFLYLACIEYKLSNKMSQTTHSSNSGVNGKGERNTFGWKPTVETKDMARGVGIQRPVGISTPISSPMSKDLSLRSPNTRQNLSIYGGSKRGNNSQSLSQNPTPNTKPLLHASKKSHANILTPQKPGIGSSSPNSRLPYLKSNQSPSYAGSKANGSNLKVTNSQSQVSIKKAASSPVFSRVLSKVELSKEFLAKLDSKDLVELTIQPERAALSQCFTSLTELETLCEETAVMKVSHPTTKMKERINDLDQIVENARNVLLKVVAIYRELFPLISIHCVDALKKPSKLNGITFNTHYVSSTIV